MALVPGSLQVDIFVTNVPNDPEFISPAGTVHDKQKPDPQPKRYSWAPERYPATLHAPRMSQPSTSMEDVPLDSNPRIPTYIVPPEVESRQDRPRVSISDDYNALLVPSLEVGPSGGRYGNGGLEEYELGLGGGGHYHEDTTWDVLDDTHFNGDLDAEVVPAEESLNRRLRREGAARRRESRETVMRYQSRNSSWMDPGQQLVSPMVVVSPGEYTKSSPPLSSLRGHGSRLGRDHSRSLTLDAGEVTLVGKEARRMSQPPYIQQYELGLGQRDPSKSRGKKTVRASMRHAVMDVSTVHSMMPKTGKGARGEEMEIRFSEEELEDVLAMAEYAWPGRPMLDKLLKEEVEMARGAIVVACACFFLLEFALWGRFAVLFFYRLRPNIVKCIDKEDRRGAD